MEWPAHPPLEGGGGVSDFLAIMDAVSTFSPTTSSFTTAHTVLDERMAHVEAAIAQTTAILAQNNAILL